jgi:sialate O-acetylesterase
MAIMKLSFGSILRPISTGLACAAVLLSLANPALAEVRLPKVFGSHMVLQQGAPLSFWGWADPNETVRVQLGSSNAEARANDRGEWKLTMPAMKAGGPYVVKVTGSSTVEFENVMVGEVWICSGQSNMEMGIAAAKDAKEEIAAADYPNIRLLLVAKRWTPEPQTDMEGVWKVCSPKTVAEGGWGGFSAAAYYFGRELHKKLGVAVGLIDASWGGTRIEPWTPPAGFASVPTLQRESMLVKLGDPRTTEHQERLGQVIQETEHWVTAARTAMSDRKLVPLMPQYPAELLPPRDLQQATALYNGMIHPLLPFAFRGAIWYQGESNLDEGKLYTEHMKALVNGWRAIWNLGDFPFIFVQIAPYNYGGDAERMGIFWEAQAAAEAVIPNVGMAVINDIGNLSDIHPAKKQEVGRRLALWALARTYGQKNLVYSGPKFKSMQIEGSKLRITFSDVAEGLASRDDKPLNWFEVIDRDEGGFVHADVKIEKDSLVLSAPGVEHPVAMRFAWSMLAEPNLMNSEGLPAGAFRAGTVPDRDLLGMKVPEAKDYQVVYDIDLSKVGADFSYAVDNSGKIQAGFDRIAYFLELQGPNYATDYVYVSMDAFTKDLSKIGIPTFKSGARFQQDVAKLNVYSNVKSIVTGAGLEGGNIEFWPDNYGMANSSKVPNASDAAYDTGDEPSTAADGYGSMQVHNHAANQTLFAVNHWREGAKADIGIGNQPKGNPDWTFAGNAGVYQAKRLRVLVRTAK